MSRRVLSCLAALGLASGVLVVSAPSVPAASPGLCSVDTQLEFLGAGLSITPGSGKIASKGTVQCAAAPRNIAATGPGVYVSDGTWEGTCASPGGEFHFKMTFPTASGQESVEGGGPYQGFVFSTDQGAGTFQLVEIDGDCVTKPITRGRILGQFMFRN